MTRLFFCAGNWKMYQTPSEARAFAVDLRKQLAESSVGKAVASGKLEMALVPSFVSIAPFAEGVEGLGVRYGAQNCHFEPQGAFTGESSVAMLREIGCTYVIIGHSERRHVFGESDALIAKKTRAVLDGGLLPILCIGELLEERERGETFAVLDRQMEAVLPLLTAEEVEKRLVIAYEPVWAIGTGKVASDTDAQESCRYVRQFVKKHWGETAANGVRIQYGGSVKPDNAAGLAKQPDVDGFLIGGASLKVESFLAIANSSVLAF